ncbi:MAG: ANTAR domain-containing protein [Bacillota bacterium]|nr:ANTAR domain-containing protein [Bacillota bacterium]
MKRILLMSKNGKNKNIIISSLMEKEICEITTASRAEIGRQLFLDASYDLIVVNTPLEDEFGDETAALVSRKTGAGVIILIKKDLVDRLAAKMEKSGVMVVAKPMIKGMLFQAVGFAQAAKQRIAIVQEENEKLTARLNAVKTVNKAKWALVKYLNMSEEQAHKYIEKQAMDRHLPKEAVACRILKTYGN